MFDKNGNWSSDFYPEQDRDNEVPITASKFQTLIQDNLKQSFENCILRDGSGLPTANINLNRKKITNLANASSDLDAVNKSQLDAAMATNATEEDLGTVRIATEEETLKGEDDTIAVSPLKLKTALSSLATSTRFAVNSGKATDGKPDLLAGQFTATLSFKVDDGTSYAPLTATTADGEAFSLRAIASVDVSGLMNGTYNVFVSPEGTAKVFSNNVYRQQSQPTAMNTNDIWFNTCEPNKAYIKTSEGLEETKLVQIPQVVVMANNVISAIETIAYYNDNGNGNTRASDFDYLANAITPDLTSGVSKSWNTEHTAETSGWISFTSFMIDEGAALVLTVNGIKVVEFYCAFDAQNRYQNQILLSKGDTYKLTGGHSGQSATFYPCKGVI